MYLLSLYGDPEEIVLEYDKLKGFKAKTPEEIEEEEAAKLAALEGSDGGEGLEDEDGVPGPKKSDAPDGIVSKLDKKK